MSESWVCGSAPRHQGRFQAVESQARELDVLGLVATGNSNREDSQVLSISEETVKGHVKTILEKLGAADRTHAVLLAITRGFLQI